MITDVFNRITSSAFFVGACLSIFFFYLSEPHRSCYSKCIGARFTGGELNKGESVCVDRCVAKYFEVNKMIGEKLQQMGAGAQTAGQKSFTSL